jgi:hypothetical protein
MIAAGKTTEEKFRWNKDELMSLHELSVVKAQHP